VFGIKAFNPLFGSFFSHAYGILAFGIPIYLGYAAFILADPRWRPERFFLLCATPFPFLTLAVGFICIRDFDVLSEGFPLLEFTGKTGFGLIAVVLALLEVAAIQAIKNALFPKVNESEQKDGIRGNRGNRRSTSQPLLPPPQYGALEPDAPDRNADSFPAAAAEPVTEPAVEPAAEPFVIHLPAMRPLNSPLALEYLGANAERPHEKEKERDSVERALEEAEVIAALHSEQVRKKTSGAHSTRSSKKKYHVPVAILNEYPDGEYWVIDQATRDAAITLKRTLEEFKIQAEVTGIRKGPVITMFEILPAPGVKLSKITNLQDNIALRLAASSVRIVAPIPGKHAVGIEVPNAKRNIVSFREIIESELQREGKRLEIPVVLGKNISGEAQTLDLTQTPHLLIAGATGSGKSVCVNAMILSMLYRLSPAECRLILIDPKIVELKLYNDIPHLLTPVITEPKRAFQALQYCICEMERRYACLDKMGVRDIHNYNKRIKERNIAQENMPYIVIIIDEFADLMATTGKELESTVARLAAMSRAVGIHLVLATQRPSIDVITGLIKANIPSRIAFMVAGRMNSQIIIDSPGAEKLLGKGDMLYLGKVEPFPIRMQGAFVSEEDVEAVVEHVKTLGEPDYIDDEIFYDDEEEDLGPSLFSDGDDPLYDKALEIVLQQGKASASYIQRRLKIGYNRAARLVEEMEQKGVVGPAQGSKPREVLRGI
ncbi:MAG: DNA translocase FtsK, partial [Treponema sp.]|nr:DNA translocase FtsK [Treponema sp.]